MSSTHASPVAGIVAGIDAIAADPELTAAGVMRLVCDQAIMITGADGAVVELADGDAMTYAVAAGSLHGHEGLRVSLDGSLSGLCVTSREVLICTDSESDPRVDRAATRKVGARSMIVVPLLRKNECIGVIKVAAAQPDSFGARAVDTLSALAGFLTTVIEHAQSLDERRRERETYRMVIESSSDVVLQLRLDGTITFASQAAATVLGYPPSQLIGMRNADLVHPDRREELLALARDASSSGLDTRWEFPCLRADGSTVWLESAGSTVHDSQGAPLFRIVRLRDITDIHRDREALAVSEARFRSTMANAPIGMCLVGPDGSLLEVNPAMCALLDRPADVLLVTTWQELTHAEDLEKDLSLVAQVLDGTIDQYRITKRYLRPDGSIVWGDLSVSCLRDPEGKVAHFISQIVDVTEAMKRHEDLQEQATSDALTGLLNRAEFERRLRGALATPRRVGQQVLVAFADIDGLKQINDTAGHAAGDELLRRVAERVKRRVRDEDLVARVGGDELVVLLPGTGDVADGVSALQRMLAEVNRPFTYAGQELRPRMSIGVTTTHPGEDPAVVLQRADQAMYRAKQSGGNIVMTA